LIFYLIFYFYYFYNKNLLYQKIFLSKINRKEIIYLVCNFWDIKIICLLRTVDNTQFYDFYFGCKSFGIIIWNNIVFKKIINSKNNFKNKKIFADKDFINKKIFANNRNIYNN